jgi:hypothetical protein
MRKKQFRKCRRRAKKLGRNNWRRPAPGPLRGAVRWLSGTRA